MLKTTPQNAQNCSRPASSVCSLSPPPRRGGEREQAEQGVSSEQQIRAAINRSSPGLLNFLDAARNKFPTAKLKAIELNQDGEWRGQGKLWEDGNGR